MDPRGNPDMKLKDEPNNWIGLVLILALILAGLTLTGKVNDAYGEESTEWTVTKAPAGKGKAPAAKAKATTAKAKLTNSTSQKRRADELFQTKSITEQEHEQALLDYADSKAAVVRAQVAVGNARIQLEDTDVRAPITGTIIEKDIERGQVIASATTNVSGGTTLMKMADLNSVQVRTRVDETDIGKIRPGLPTKVTVTAYPNQPFDGEVVVDVQSPATYHVVLTPG